MLLAKYFNISGLIIFTYLSTLLNCICYSDLLGKVQQLHKSFNLKKRVSSFHTLFLIFKWLDKLEMDTVLSIHIETQQNNDHRKKLRSRD